MGVKNFHKEFLGRDEYDMDDEGVPKHSLGDLGDGSVVVVDVMSPLYTALSRTSDAANAFDTKPSIPLTAAVSNFKKGEIGTLLNYSKKLKFIIVLDGSEHKAKEMEHRVRKEKREIAQAKLNELYEAGFESDINEASSILVVVLYSNGTHVS